MAKIKMMYNGTVIEGELEDVLEILKVIKNEPTRPLPTMVKLSDLDMRDLI